MPPLALGNGQKPDDQPLKSKRVWQRLTPARLRSRWNCDPHAEGQDLPVFWAALLVCPRGLYRPDAWTLRQLMRFINWKHCLFT